MKKKIKIFIVIVIMLFLAIHVFGRFYGDKSNGHFSQYVIYEGTLNCDGNMYIECELSVEAVGLDKQIGITQDGKQIYSILGLDSSDFICMRVEGNEIIFRNAALNPLTDIQQLKIYKMTVRQDSDFEDFTTIEDQDIIDELLSMKSDENIVVGDIIGNIFHDITLYSKKYDGLCYEYSYVVDGDGYEYLYDYYSGTAWKFTKHMFDVEVHDE